MTRSQYAVRHAVPPRKWLALLALLSFFFQSLAVQTHIHPQLSQPAAKAAQAPKSAPAPLKNQEPTDQCRLCQEMVHAGHMVTPSAVAAFASLSLVTAIFAAQSFGLDQPATAYSWNSRAPPRR